MKFIKTNIAELILLVGITSISTGFFILSLPLGFILTGLMLVGLACLLWLKGGD